ncbi:hypothetical protein EW146_g7077 [Bondarzewia mesenterica]|uniref:Mitochondrial glycine transporter n=1 Tax=Bondarzewia mesenterica TaxID=1095465 RepID=A0A4S4LNM7_9AGAM|nr:hypothetical protein EW146_g7077 [Bondarzewia mesenterica]
MSERRRVIHVGFRDDTVDLLKTRLQQGEGTQQHARAPNTILRTAKRIIATDGMRGLWRGTEATLVRNVPGIALYMTGLNQVRSLMATSPYFAPVRDSNHSGIHKHASVLPALTNQGNLLAGAATRVSVGFVLNPFSVLKARYESDMYAYGSLTAALGSIVRSGPSELLRGFLASSLRDAPYAGLFIVFYEGIKREAAIVVPPSSQATSAALQSMSAASAGLIATLATHPFDVIKVRLSVLLLGRRLDWLIG